MEEFPRKAIPVIVEKDEHASARNFARMVTSPEVAACRVINRAENKSGIGEQVDVPAMLEQLRDEAAAVNRGDLSQVEAMLTNQATALQTLFARLSEKGLAAEYLPQYEAYMRMALRAQSQCTRTLEVLAALKNPPLVIARQANVTSGPQQNNFGLPSRAGQTENKPTELLEATDGERLDTRTTPQAVRSDTTLEAVDAKHRAQNVGRQGSVI